MFLSTGCGLGAIIHFWLPSGAHWHNCDPSFCRQAADLVHVSDLGLATGAHWLKCEPSFCRQAADLVRVSDFGLPTGTHWLNRESLLHAQAADLLRVSHIGLLKNTCWPDLSPLRGTIDPIVTPFCVHRLWICCVWSARGTR